MTRVLVANPDASLRALYQNAFLGAGCEVIEAHDGHDALVKALTSPPTLVVTELHLPLLDGPALCQVLRRDRTFTDIPIMVVTTDTRPAELERARQAGATTVLTRPPLDEILRESNRLLARVRVLSEKVAALSQRIPDQLERAERVRSFSVMQREASVLRQQSAQLRHANFLLACLPTDEAGRLAPHLRPIAVRRKQVLQRGGEPIDQVYFPLDGVYSLVSGVSGGGVGAATVGSEGVIGIEAFLSDSPVATSETVLVVPGTQALALNVEVFRRELAGGTLRKALGDYARTLLAEMMLSVGCLAGHTIRQRTARWLLMAHDRMNHADFELSHESLAIALGVSRPTITQVAGALKQAGHIRYSQRRISILSREGLAAEACECYGMMRSGFDGLMASSGLARVEI